MENLAYLGSHGNSVANALVLITIHCFVGILEYEFLNDTSNNGSNLSPLA